VVGGLEERRIPVAAVRSGNRHPLTTCDFTPGARSTRRVHNRTERLQYPSASCTARHTDLDVSRFPKKSAKSSDRLAGWLRETGGGIQYREADRAVARAVECGLFVVEREAAFEFVHHARTLGDMRAQYAACVVGARELGRLVTRYGTDGLRGHLTALLDYAERMTRAEISTWPRGTYRFTDHIDSDGLSDDPVLLSVAITVRENGALLVDWAGTSRQVRAAINSTLSFTKSNAFLSVRCALLGDIPNNAGVFRCIEVTAPEGSVLNPVSPAAVAARALTGYRVMDTMFGALAQIVPHIMPAAGEGGNTVVCLGGRHPDNRPFIIVDMISGCWGGRPDKDGIEAITNPSQNLSNTPVEVLERQHPVRIEEYALVPDSGGAGRFRGGLGLARSYRLLADEAVLQLRADRLRFPPYGLNGGAPGGPSANWLGEGDQKRTIPGKITMTMQRSELLTHHQAGGGGHGDPFTRDPEAVARDVWNGKVTAAAARTQYGVAVDPHSGRVDAAATVGLRAARH